MGPTWGQIGSNVDPFELKWASLDPVESLAAYLGPIGFQTTTININTNNRFLLPRGGLTVCLYGVVVLIMLLGCSLYSIF
jgi:hypothetical protein